MHHIANIDYAYIDMPCLQVVESVAGVCLVLDLVASLGGGAGREGGVLQVHAAEVLAQLLGGTRGKKQRTQRGRCESTLALSDNP